MIPQQPSRHRPAVAPRGRTNSAAVGGRGGREAAPRRRLAQSPHRLTRHARSRGMPLTTTDLRQKRWTSPNSPITTANLEAEDALARCVEERADARGKQQLRPRYWLASATTKRRTFCATVRDATCAAESASPAAGRAGRAPPAALLRAIAGRRRTAQVSRPHPADRRSGGTRGRRSRPSSRARAGCRS